MKGPDYHGLSKSVNCSLERQREESDKKERQSTDEYQRKGQGWDMKCVREEYLRSSII